MSRPLLSLFLISCCLLLGVCASCRPGNNGPVLYDDDSGDDDSGDDDSGDDDAGDDDSGDDDTGDDDDNTPAQTDTDGDGSPDTEDCAPEDSSIYPGADDPCDGLDSDCGFEAEDVPTGAAQEMFVAEGGRLYIQVTSVDADCDIYLDLVSPHQIDNLVGEVHLVVNTLIDIGPIPLCSSLAFVANSCGTDHPSTDPEAFEITPIRFQGWRLNHEDQQFDILGPDFNDVVFEAEVGD